MGTQEVWDPSLPLSASKECAQRGVALLVIGHKFYHVLGSNRNALHGSREMALWLGMCTASAEDPDPFLSTPMAAHACL